MPLFTLIARATDKLILVESLDIQDDKTAELEHHRRQAKEVLGSIHSHDNSGIVSSGPYYYIYLIEHDIIYLTCCASSYPKNFAYSFLSEIKKEFDLSHGTEATSVKRPFAFEAFDTFIQKTKKLYMDTKSQRNLNKVNTELKDIEKIMTKSIADIIGRGSKIDDVMAKSSTLTSHAKKYKDSATEINRLYWWRTYGPLIGGAAFFLLLIVFRYWWF